MSRLYKVILVGFSAFEQQTLESCFRLSRGRIPAYEPTDELADADVVIADADRADALQTLTRAGRLHDAVFVGDRIPPGAVASTHRPIDPMQVWRALDRLIVHRAGVRPAPYPAPVPVRVTGEAAAAPRAEPVPVATAPAGRPRRLSGHAVAQLALARCREAKDLADVLMVDSSEVALRHLERRLHELGLKTQRAAGSGEALQLLSRGPYCAVFMDVELGEHSELDGLALCQHLRQQRGGGGAPLLFMLSAHAAPVDRVRGTLAGCDDYLAKPLDDDRLHELLARHGLIAMRPATAEARTG